MSDSSGDLIADRRLVWAMASLEAGDVAAAAELVEQSLARVPDWAAAWAALADAREKLGDRDAAAVAWQQVMRCDKIARLGAPLHLARLSGATPAAMPPGYVAALFDDYAPRFESHLLEALHYRGPALLLQALLALRPDGKFGRVLDLGCGTGLMGAALAGHAETVDGIDVSAGMIAVARRSGHYGDLHVGALPQALAGLAPQRYGLVTAADVLVYCGDLDVLFGVVARLLAPQGLFAATLQRHDGEGYRLGADLRFAHAPAYVTATAAAAGLRILLLKDASTRREAGVAVPGLVFVAALL